MYHAPSHLPVELCRIVASFLHTYDAQELAPVNKHWARALRTCSWLWQRCHIASHYLQWHDGVMTRTKRKRNTVFVEPMLWHKGAHLQSLTIGLKSAPAPLVLQNTHLHAIADQCVHLKTLKVFFQDADVSMDALRYLTTSCPHLVNVALPVAAISVFDPDGDVFSPVQNQVQVMRLTGNASYMFSRHSAYRRTWIGQSLVRLKLCEITNFDQVMLTSMLTHVPHLRELLVFHCSAPSHDASHDVHPPNDPHLLHDVTSMWLVHLASQLRVLALVSSDTVICTVFLLNALFSAAPLTWPQLGVLMLDSNVLDTAGHPDQLRHLISCADCTKYDVWRKHPAHEITRCNPCRQRIMPLVHTMLLF